MNLPLFTQFRGQKLYYKKASRSFWIADGYWVYSFSSKRWNFDRLTPFQLLPKSENYKIYKKDSKWFRRCI